MGFLRIPKAEESPAPLLGGRGEEEGCGEHKAPLPPRTLAASKYFQLWEYPGLGAALPAC